MISKINKNMTTQLNRIDEIEENFYKFLKDKNIEPSSLNDLDRLEREFNNTLDKMIKITKEIFPIEEQYNFVKSRLIIDFHYNLGLKYKLEPTLIASALGKYNEKLIIESQKIISNTI